MTREPNKRSGFIDIARRIYRVFYSDGFSGVVCKVGDYIRYNLKEKWEFVFFELDLRELPFSLPNIDESIVVRRAGLSDIKKIRNDLYPYMGKREEIDKLYIDNIGTGDFECFIAIKGYKYVHYFMVFKSAIESPLLKSPFNRQMVRERDAYIGGTFTAPNSRGMWIVPHVLLTIIEYLQKETSATRIILLVNKNTPGAVGFYSRLGFKVIDYPYPKRMFFKLPKME